MSTTPSTASLYESGASNIDILDSIGSEVLAESTPATAPPAAADTGVADASTTSVTSPADGTAAVAGEVPKPEWFETAPPEYKNLAAHANLSKADKDWLEKTYGELNGLKASPIATPESLTELTEMYPGGMDDIRESHTAAQQYRTEMEQYRSADPAQQTELLGGLIQDSPDAFVAMLHSGASLLKQTLRDDYTAFATDLTKEHLDTITDGKFGSFFDGIVAKAIEYNSLLETNPEAAAKVAAKLGGAALQMADWWGSAKNKLGYGEKAAGAVPGSRQAVQKAPDDREIAFAQKESNFWVSNYFIKHDQTVNPLINQALTRELTVRGMDKLPANWRGRVAEAVSQGIKSNLASDKTFKALEDRTYRRNAPSDPRKWDNSDQAARVLLNAAKQRADKLIPTLLKRALDELATLPGLVPAKSSQPGADTRSSASTPGAGGTNAGWEQDLKDGKITSAEAIQRMAGVA